MQKCLLSMPSEFNIVMASLKLQQHIHFLYICLKYICRLVDKLNFCISFSDMRSYIQGAFFTAPVPKSIEDDKFAIRGQFGTGTNLAPESIWHQECKRVNLAPEPIWHRNQFGTKSVKESIWHQECKRSQFGTGTNLAPRV